jgi:hypothetical protein
VFTEVFERSIAQCKASGLIGGKLLHVDVTTIRGDIDRDRVGRPDSSDPDARYGRFPGGGKQPGYKQQTVVDHQSRVVVGLSVMPANRIDHEGALAVIDEAVTRLDHPPEAVCADAAYANGSNRAALEERGVRLVSPPKKPRTYTKTDYFTIESFTYDHRRDEFVCPGGRALRYAGGVKHRPDRRRYRASQTDCRRCALKAQCTRAPRRELKVGVHHAALARLRADSTTVSFQRLYRSRAPAIEGVFGEAKQWHGLRRAWRRGLRKMRVQSLLIAAAINFKRLIAAFSLEIRCIQLFVNAIVSVWRAIISMLRIIPVKHAVALKH